MEWENKKAFGNPIWVWLPCENLWEVGGWHKTVQTSSRREHLPARAAPGPVPHPNRAWGEGSPGPTFPCRLHPQTCERVTVASDARRQAQPAFTFCKWIQQVSRRLPTVKMSLKPVTWWLLSCVCVVGLEAFAAFVSHLNSLSFRTSYPSLQTLLREYEWQVNIL